MRTEAPPYQPKDNSMRHNATHTSGARSRAGRLGRASSVAAGFLAVGLLTAACGGGSSPSAGTREDPGIAYAACMRSHGVPNFPDPVMGANGSVSVHGVNPNAPHFQTADQACKHLMHGSGEGPQQLTAAQVRAYLSWAACIRASGVPSFPDPTFANGSPQFNISKGNDPQALRRAAQLCTHYLTGVPGGSPIGQGPKQ